VVLCCFCGGTAVAKKKPPVHPVNLNTASAAELQLVPGIGPSTADKILQMRKSYGAYKSVDDLLAVKGIGQKRLDKMRKYLTVGKAQGSQKSQRKAQAASASSPAKAPPAKTSSSKPTTAVKTPPPKTTEEEEEEP
jgi:competence ComEA-like helix-hairpin-helix protein